MQAHDSSILTSRRHRVVIVGAGFGGLFAAKALRGADVDVTVIDRTNHHLFQPLLYQLATGILAEGDIAPTDPRHPAAPAQRKRDARRGGGNRSRGPSLTVNTLGQHSEVAYDSVILAAGPGSRTSATRSSRATRRE